jgi:hypothetical protein
MKRELAIALPAGVALALGLWAGLVATIALVPQ